MRNAALFLVLLSVGCSNAGGRSLAVVVTSPAVGMRLPLNSDRSVQIRYTDSDTGGTAVTTIVAVPRSGAEVVIAANRPSMDSEVQSVVWETAGVPAGTYSIRARISNGLLFADAVAPGAVQLNAPPQVALIRATPATVSRSGLVRIQYTDADADDDAQTTIFADVDGDPTTATDTIEIAQRTEANGESSEVLWDTSGLPEGEYTIFARVEDGTNEPVAAAPVQISIANNFFAQASTRGGPVALPTSQSVSVFPDGATVLVGVITTETVLGAGEANETTLSAAGTFVARYDSGGRLSWARLVTPSFLVVRLRAMDDDTTVLFGASSSTTVFSSGRPDEARISLPRFRSTMLRAQFDREGALLGVEVLALPFSLVSAVDDGTLTVGGQLTGTMLLGEGEPNETLLVGASATETDAYLARYGADGALLWAVSHGGGGFETVTGVCTLPDGSSVLLGRFTHVATFGRGDPGESTLVSRGASDGFVARHSPAGRLQWVRAIGSSGNELPIGVIASRDNSVVVLSVSGGTVTLGGGEERETRLTGAGMLVARYDEFGSLLWGRLLRAETGFLDAPAMVGSIDGSVIVSGAFTGSVTLGSGAADERTLVSSGAGSLFLARFRDDGSLAWASRGGERNDAGSFRVSAIAAGSDGSAVVTGIFDTAITFASGEENETRLEPSGRSEIFLARFNADGGS